LFDPVWRESRCRCVGSGLCRLLLMILLTFAVTLIAVMLLAHLLSRSECVIVVNQSGSLTKFAFLS
jgi:hypothetical protein